MKRVVLLFTAGVFAISSGAQDTKNSGIQRSYLSFHAGVSFPIVCYASTSFSNKNAGFAKPGFTVDITYGYRFARYTGIAGSLFYSGNKTRNDLLAGSGKEGYRYFGIVAGPMLIKKLSSKWEGDIRFMAGIAKALSPELVHHEEVLLNKEGATAFVWTAGAGIRYSLSDKTYLSFKADHTQLKPQFKTNGSAQKSEQHIVVINVDAGVGIKF